MANAPRGLARRARYALEGALAWPMFALLGALPLGVASGLGALLGGLIGPRLAAHRRAGHNLRRALPELSAAEAERTLGAMWRHLGRVAAEYPHLKHFHVSRAGGRIELVGAEHLDQAKQGPGIFFSGHIGNWEVAALAPEQNGTPVALIYRAPNNPIVDRLIRRARGAVADFRVPKGASGGRDIVRFLRGGGHLAMLVDQKLNDGIPVPFFGRDAMTAPALAQLALKYRCPVVPARVERLIGARFRLTIHAPMALPDSGDRSADVAETMRRVNALLEDWIRARPEQWLWLHRRWPE